MRLQCRVADTVFSSHRSFSACYHRCGCLLLAESLCNTPNRPTPKVKNQLTNARHTVIAHRRWIYLHPKGQRHAIISFEHRRQLDRCCADLDRPAGRTAEATILRLQCDTAIRGTVRTALVLAWCTRRGRLNSFSLPGLSPITRPHVVLRRIPVLAPCLPTAVSLALVVAVAPLSL